MKWKVQMVQENKKRKKDIGSKVVESFEDFSGVDFKDIVSFPDGRNEMVIRNIYEKGKVVTCRKEGEGKTNKIRKNMYLLDKGLEPVYSREFSFNGNSSDFEKGQYAYWNMVLNSEDNFYP